MPQASSGSQPSPAPYKPVPLTIDIGGYTRLNGFVGQRQAARTWCWAAVASSIEGWYALRYHDFPTDPGGQTEPPRSQCEFVRKFLHRKACKLDRLDGDCSKNGCAIQDGQDIGFVTSYGNRQPSRLSQILLRWILPKLPRCRSNRSILTSSIVNVYAPCAASSRRNR